MFITAGRATSRSTERSRCVGGLICLDGGASDRFHEKVRRLCDGRIGCTGVWELSINNLRIENKANLLTGRGSTASEAGGLIPWEFNCSGQSEPIADSAWGRCH